MNDIETIIDDICIHGEVHKYNKNNDTSLHILKGRLYDIASKSVGVSDMTFENIDGKYKRLEDKDIKATLMRNFPLFGYYHIILNSMQLSKEAELGLGDAIDDLCDIIKDLSEVRWRIKNISMHDGLSFLKFIFNAHTESHIVNLIYYIKELDDQLKIAEQQLQSPEK